MKKLLPILFLSPFFCQGVITQAEFDNQQKKLLN